MAVLLIWSLVGLLVVRTLLTIVLIDSLIDAYGESLLDAGLAPREYLEGIAPAYVPIALIQLVLFGGLLALCAIFVARGARWAPITATVTSVLALLGSLLVFVQASTGLFIVVNVLVAVTALGVIYYLFRAGAEAGA